MQLRSASSFAAFSAPMRATAGFPPASRRLAAPLPVHFTTLRCQSTPLSARAPAGSPVHAAATARASASLMGLLRFSRVRPIRPAGNSTIGRGGVCGRPAWRRCDPGHRAWTPRSGPPRRPQARPRGLVPRLEGQDEREVPLRVVVAGMDLEPAVEAREDARERPRQDLRVATAAAVPAAGPEERVAGEELPARLEEDRPGRVARGLVHADAERAERDLGPAAEVLVRREARRVGAVSEHARAEPGPQRRRAAGVVRVAMGVEDEPGPEPVRRRHPERDHRVAGIDERGVLALAEEVDVVVGAVPPAIEDHGASGTSSGWWLSPIRFPSGSWK